MPDVNGPGKEPSEKRRFINEKIVRQPLTKRQMAKRALVFLFAALLFGVIAAAGFVVSMPYAQRYLSKETEESQTVSIPRDEPETPASEFPTETLEQASETAPEETQPLEDMLQSAMEEYQFSSKDVESLAYGMRALAQQADKGVVVVHSVQQEVDWFDNPVETSGLYAGVVIAHTRQELLILTPERAAESADSIRVTFSDGTEVRGQVKQMDTISGMAIVSVRVDDLSEETLSRIESVELGNSYTVKQGDVIIAIGSPAGQVHSTDYGTITYITRSVQVTDGISRILHSNVRSSAAKGTFLINMAGELIGWVTEEYQNEDTSSMTLAMAISDYKGILQNLTNGVTAPYFGIQGQEVSEEMEGQGLPKGVYVTASIANSPAYNAGIQNGDVITELDGEPILTMKDFQSTVERLIYQETVPVTVQRRGRAEYTELRFDVVVGAR